ncbi:MAG: nitroreductase family protein [Microthrixaceae bacterium]|nr:nitroreductase family protein [Microthrixaceae bacterium]
MPADPPFDLEQIDRLLTTTKAVRRRLDLERSVDRETVVDCIRLASYSPNASNAQEWHWVIVDDPEQRAAVGEQYRKCTVPLVSKMLAVKEANGDEAGARISRSIIYLAEHMAQVPVLVIPCYDLEAGSARYGRLIGPDRETPTMEPGMYASIYPAVWSFLLALRSRGLGSVLTTAHQEDQAAMAEILGIPSTWDQTALLPVAHTTGGDFKPSRRAPVEDTIVWNRYQP